MADGSKGVVTGVAVVYSVHSGQTGEDTIILPGVTNAEFSENTFSILVRHACTSVPISYEE